MVLVGNYCGRGRRFDLVARFAQKIAFKGISKVIRIFKTFCEGEG